MKPIIVTAELATVGLRVTRGRDWKWSDQDHFNGIPCSGVITEIGPSDNCSKGWAKVRWENGDGKRNYRIGSFDGTEIRYDLYVYSPLGNEIKPEPEMDEARMIEEAGKAAKSLERSIVRGLIMEQTKPNKNDRHTTEPIKVRRPISTIQGPKRRIYSPIKGRGI